MERDVTNITSSLNRIEVMIMRPQTQPAPPVDHMALAIQRALDLAGQKQGNSQSPILIGLAFIGCITIGGAAIWALGIHR